MFGCKMLTVDEIESIKDSTVFNEQEIEILYDRFNYLDRNECGHLTFNEFQMIPEFHSNPFSRLILEYLERKTGYELINFACYLEFLSLFSAKTDKVKRVRYLFDIFDLNRNGQLCADVLHRLSGLMGGPDSETVEEVLSRYGGEKDYLDVEDFARLYAEDPTLEENMLIDFSRFAQKEKKVSFWELVWPTYFSSKDE